MTSQECRARETPSASPDRDLVLLTVEEAAQRLHIGRTRMFALIGSGEIESVRIGRLRRVRPTALQEYAARLAAAQNGQTAA